MPLPHVLMAVICEEARLGDDDAPVEISGIRQGLEIGHDPDHPDQMPTVRIEETVFTAFAGSDFQGTAAMAVKVVTPDGDVHEIGGKELEFSAPGEPVFWRFSFRLDTSLEGLFWIVIEADGNELTRVPYRLVYRRVLTA